MDNKKHIVNLESFRDMLHICLRLPGQSFVEPPFEEEILAFLRFLGHSGAIRKLTDEDFVYQVEHKDTKKSNEMYYPRFTKVIIHHFMSKDPSIPRRNKTRSSSDTTTPPPTAAASPRLTISEKGKQATKSSKAKSLSALSEVAMTEAQKLKIVTKKSLQQTHISQASGSGIDEGTDEGDDEEDDEEEVGDDEQVSDEEEFIHPSLSTHAKEDTRDEEIQQAPLPPTTAPSTLLQDLPNFGSLFGFDNRLKTLEANFSEFMKTNQFAGAVSSIPGIVQRYMDQWMNEAVKVAVQIQSDRLHDEAQKENDDFSRLLWSLSFPSHIDHRK
nr:hypothetical protein [Tanacetum cinerariifolium]